MQSSQQTVYRPPDPCPTHGAERAVRTSTRQSGPLEMRQNACAENCGAPLGWQFTDQERGIFLHGPGECQDTRVETAFRIRRNEELTAPLIGLAFTTGCVIASLVLTPIVALACGAAVEGLEYALKGLAVAAPLGAACVAGIAALRRRRPEQPDYARPAG